MLLSIASVALALQLGVHGYALSDGEAVVQQIQYRVPVRPPPCDHGWDLSARDGMCYPNGYLPRREMDAYRRGHDRGGDRYYPLEYGGGRRPVPCGHGADVDIRDGLCYPNGTVPRRYQQGRQGYHIRRNGYYEMR